MYYFCRTIYAIMDSQDLITIYSERTPNPESMKFVVNKMILPNDSADFRTAASAVEESPLANSLFESFDYVNGIFIMNNFVSVTKRKEDNWDDLINPIKDFLQAYIQESKPILNPKTALSGEEESEVVAKIKQLLNDHVKPAVEMDGGAIDFKSFEEGVVTVQMKGACSGCPSSTMTLKAGIENLLKRMIPEVEAVESEAV
jgi:Fe-S cluster biogenesis protein NfuA